VTAQTPFGEKTAGAMPLAVSKINIVVAILTAEFYGKLSEGNPVCFL
jgi:hypothetical protein